MFKIDWPCAIGGAIIGYYAKGEGEAAKTTIKKISTDAVTSLKESFYDYEKPQGQTTQPDQGKQG